MLNPCWGRKIDVSSGSSWIVYMLPFIFFQSSFYKNCHLSYHTAVKWSKGIMFTYKIFCIRWTSSVKCSRKARKKSTGKILWNKKNQFVPRKRSEINKTDSFVDETIRDCAKPIKYFFLSEWVCDKIMGTNYCGSLSLMELFCLFFPVSKQLRWESLCYLKTVCMCEPTCLFICCSCAWQSSYKFLTN